MSDTWYKTPNELPPYEMNGRRWLVDGTCLDPDPHEGKSLADIIDDMVADVVTTQQQTVSSGASIYDNMIDAMRRIDAARSEPSRYISSPAIYRLWYQYTSPPVIKPGWRGIIT